MLMTQYSILRQIEPKITAISTELNFNVPLSANTMVLQICTFKCEKLKKKFENF